ncbi:thioredoxin family protein [Streptomyces morookaense]|uniref:Thioredoxin family protein n=1 Tax=Streptomyces morookaense TaxID=1970 RepID=A0A7Y7B2F6_STRMO|nr:thioredoxin family protein [Streptomyces morookaense]NVK77780.1 thioredoxin family protein [Streptomyces morookaense]GHF19867.1 hypothetical protein GCM10010359_21370 [Streptomyces morookaense]
MGNRTRIIRFPEQGLPGTLVSCAEGEDPVEREPSGLLELPSEAQLIYAADTDGDGLAALAELPPDTFTVVDLGGATDEAIRSVAGQRGLRTLVLSGDFTDEGVAALGGMPELTDLVLESSCFTGTGLAALAGTETFGSLRSLVLSDAPALESERLHALSEAHRLTGLTLDGIRVDDALADVLLALAPSPAEVWLTERPGHELDLAVLERLLGAGLEVNGVRTAPRHAARFARIAADAATMPDLPDGESAAPPRGGVLHEITEERELDRLLSQPLPILVDLTAPWCGPCEILAPVLEDTVEAHGAGLIGVQIDISRAEWARQRFDALGVPAVVLLRDGREVSRFSGVWPRQRITDWLATAGVDGIRQGPS